MRWCSACVLPDTRPNLAFGDDGVCDACRTHGRRTEIDWESRWEAFVDLVRDIRALGARWDCVVPVSGGKDSTWQVVICREAGLHPLAVTWRAPGRTGVGQANLDNLIALGVDHIDLTINPDVEARFMVKTLRAQADTAIPMHLALFGFPLTIAARFDIPLVVWGENSASEYGGDDVLKGAKMDELWLRRYGVSAGTVADDWVDDDLTMADLAPYRYPSADELARTAAVFLGWYLPWDPQTSLAVAEAHGFRRDPGGPRVGLYDYADIDDHFISLHHWPKWHKFGFTRLFDNLSLEIRNGRMTRDDAIEVIRATGDQRPAADIDRFCAFAGMTVADFDATLDGFRNPDVWERHDGTWVIPDFLVPDWSWR